MKNVKLRKNIKNKLIILMTIFYFAMSSISNAEETGKINKKTESIYVNVDSYGNVVNTNIYNYFDLSNVDELVDYGDYESVSVITGSNKPLISGDELSWNTSGDKKLGYIGKIANSDDSKLPWHISIKYYLNGLETLASELPHKSGLVKVTIKLTPNKNAPEVYQNNFMMQISSSFDMSKYVSVSSKDAIEAIVGNTKSLTFMVLPGYEKEINIELGTEDFSMNSITFAIVPLEGDILELVQDIKEDREKLREAWDLTNESLEVILNQFSNSSKNIDKLINTSSSLKKGLNEVNSNSQERISYLDALSNELNTISGDFTLIDSKITTILDDTEYLKTRITETKDLIIDIKKDLKELNNSLNSNLKDLERLRKRSQELDDDLADLSKLLSDLAGSITNLNKLLGSIDLAGDIDLNAISKGLYGIKTNTESIATEAGAKMQTGGSDPEFYMEVISTAKEIGNSLKKVSTELEKADDLIGDTNTNTDKLSKNLKQVQKDLYDVANEVDGISEYAKDVPQTVSNLSGTIKSIIEVTDDVISCTESNTEIDERKLLDFIDKLDGLIKETQSTEKDFKSINSTVINSLDLAKRDLSITQTEIHNSTIGVISDTQNLLGNIKGITNQSSNLKKAKNQIYNTITSDLDDIENKTTIFNIDPDAKIPSFASEKNDSPEKLQIFIQSEAIKEIKNRDIEDMEKTKEKLSFFEKIMQIFEKIKEFFANLFK